MLIHPSLTLNLCLLVFICGFIVPLVFRLLVHVFLFFLVSQLLVFCFNPSATPFPFCIQSPFYPPPSLSVLYTCTYSSQGLLSLNLIYFQMSFSSPSNSFLPLPPLTLPDGSLPWIWYLTAPFDINIICYSWILTEVPFSSFLCCFSYSILSFCPLLC